MSNLSAMQSQITDFLPFQKMYLPSVSSLDDSHYNINIISTQFHSNSHCLPLWAHIDAVFNQHTNLIFTPTIQFMFLFPVPKLIYATYTKSVKHINEAVYVWCLWWFLRSTLLRQTSLYFYTDKETMLSSESNVKIMPPTHWVYMFCHCILEMKMSKQK